MNTTFAGTDVVNYTTASQMADVYQRAIARIRVAHAMVEQEAKALQDAFEGRSYDFDISMTLGHSNSRLNMEQIVDKMKRSAWGRIIEKIGVRKVMSSKQQKELDDYLQGGRQSYGCDKSPEMPDITADNILSVIGGYYQAAPDMLMELIREEYDFWKAYRPSEYKRNSFEKLTPRIIKAYIVSMGYGRNPFGLNYNNASHVTALDSIFHLLDGQGPLTGHKGPLADAINGSADGTGETEYFRFKCYKNHNIHLDFKRLDLLAKLNQLAGRAWLGHTANASR